jgi:hypothetical protein
MEPTMSGLRDGERMLLPSNGSSMRYQKPLRTTTGNLIHLTSKEMEDPLISDAQLQIQDGGKCSDTKMHLLPTRRAKY